MVKLDVSDNHIHIRAHYDRRNLCMSVPGGKWIAKDKVWKYLLTPTIASTISQVFANHLTTEDKEVLRTICSRIDKARDVKSGKVPLHHPLSKTTPWQHQLIAYNVVCQLFALEQQQ